MADIDFGGVVEEVITIDEFPLEKARELQSKAAKLNLLDPAQLAHKADGFHIIKIVASRPSTPKTLEEARNTVITILRRDLNHGDGATKKLLLDTLASLGKGDPLAAEYQRKLYSLLY